MSNSKVNILNVDTNSIKVLKSKDTIALIKKYREKEVSRDEIVLGNLKLVLSAVNSYKKSGINLDDLFQVGVVGLIKSIDNFNTDLDVMFSTYAVPMIKGEIRRYLRDHSSLLRVSRQLKDIAYKTMKENETALKEMNRTLTMEELAIKLDIKEFQIKEALDSLQSVTSLSEPIYNDFDDSIELYDVIASEPDNVERFINHLSLQTGIDHLEKLEKQIIMKRYYDGLTQVEIAEEFSISQAQVSRVEKSALLTIRKYV